MPAVIRVLLVDDQQAARLALRLLLSGETDLMVVGEAGDGVAALEVAGAQHPDVVLMDLSLPRMDGIEATRQVTARWPDIRVLALSPAVADEKAYLAVKAGAIGVVVKEAGVGELPEIIRKAYRGEPLLQAEVARRMLEEIVEPPAQPAPIDPLTAGELQVLRLAAQGLSVGEMAAQLQAAEWSVHMRLTNILSKLHLAGRNQTALFAHSHVAATAEDTPATAAW